MSEGIFIFNNCLKNFSIDTIRNCTQERVKNTIGEMLITFFGFIVEDRNNVWNFKYENY